VYTSYKTSFLLLFTKGRKMQAGPSLSRFPTKGIETELKTLNVEVVSESEVRLPIGWHVNSYRHMGSPVLLFGPDGTQGENREMARWTGTCDCCRGEVGLEKDGINRFMVHLPPLTVLMKMKNNKAAEKKAEQAEQAEQERKEKKKRKAPRQEVKKSTTKRPKTESNKEDTKESNKEDAKEETESTTLEPANELIVFEWKKWISHVGWNETRIMRTELFTDYDRAAQVLFDYLPRHSEFKNYLNVDLCRQFIEHPGNPIPITNGEMDGTILHIRRQVYDRPSL